ncbi:Hypothetical_protein [Hexamita inflata]|uniref:Hypothetical_protein n=1 Tax=Hexamita inflata TaxID=28002 RepID=A0ABP1GYV9_9EUKA
MSIGPEEVLNLVKQQQKEQESQSRSFTCLKAEPELLAANKAKNAQILKEIEAKDREVTLKIEQAQKMEQLNQEIDQQLNESWEEITRKNAELEQQRQQLELALLQIAQREQESLKEKEDLSNFQKQILLKQEIQQLDFYFLQLDSNYKKQKMKKFSQWLEKLQYLKTLANHLTSQKIFRKCLYLLKHHTTRRLKLSWKRKKRPQILSARTCPASNLYLTTRYLNIKLLRLTKNSTQHIFVPKSAKRNLKKTPFRNYLLYQNQQTEKTNFNSQINQNHRPSSYQKRKIRNCAISQKRKCMYLLILFADMVVKLQPASLRKYLPTH